MIAFAFLFHPGDAFAESATPPDVEGADTLATAIEIKPNTYIKGTVQHIDDVDYYKFTTTDASTEYYVYTTEPNDNSMASSMKLCNERGSSVEGLYCLLLLQAEAQHHILYEGRRRKSHSHSSRPF